MADATTGEHASSLADRVASTRWNTRMAELAGKSWDQLDSPLREGELLAANGLLRIVEAAGLVVVELPETRVLNETTSGIPEDLGREVSAPPPGGKGYSVMGVERPGGAYVELPGIGWRDLDYAERDALRILAVVAELRRLQAERQGGDPR